MFYVYNLTNQIDAKWKRCGTPNVTNLKSVQILNILQFNTKKKKNPS